MVIRAVLLDLDGTLVDAQGAWGAAFEDALAIGRQRLPALEQLGNGRRAHIDVLQPIVREAFLGAGGGVWDREFLVTSFRRLLERFGENGPALASNMLEVYESAWPRHIQLYPEVPAVLDDLAARYKLAIVSNGLGPEQRLKIGPLGLDRWIEVCAISSELDLRKPNPAIFHWALDALGVHPGEAVHAGDDAAADVRGAIGAGLAAGVWIHRKDHIVSGEHAAPRVDFELPDLEGLVPLLERLAAPHGGAALPPPR
jgi:putative hydrolase of the HAD superfamily